MKVYVLKKWTGQPNGNPMWKLFIPEVSEKVAGLRKLTEPHTYSISSYNLRADLEGYCFKGKKIEIIDER